MFIFRKVDIAAHFYQMNKSIQMVYGHPWLNDVANDIMAKCLFLCLLVIGTKSRVGENQSARPQSKVVRSVSIKDLLATLEREPQMAKSALTQRLRERIHSDGTANWGIPLSPWTDAHYLFLQAPSEKDGMQVRLTCLTV